MACDKDHDDLEEIMSELDEYQGSGQRHICAGCAYELGLEDAQEGNQYNPKQIEALPESQAYPQRHKNAYQAYDVGYHHGKGE